MIPLPSALAAFRPSALRSNRRRPYASSVSRAFREKPVPTFSPRALRRVSLDRDRQPPRPPSPGLLGEDARHLRPAGLAGALSVEIVLGDRIARPADRARAADRAERRLARGVENVADVDVLKPVPDGARRSGLRLRAWRKPPRVELAHRPCRLRPRGGKARRREAQARRQPAGSAEG